MSDDDFAVMDRVCWERRCELFGDLGCQSCCSISNIRRNRLVMLEILQSAYRINAPAGARIGLEPETYCVTGCSPGTDADHAVIADLLRVFGGGEFLVDLFKGLGFRHDPFNTPRPDGSRDTPLKRGLKIKNKAFPSTEGNQKGCVYCVTA